MSDPLGTPASNRQPAPPPLWALPVAVALAGLWFLFSIASTVRRPQGPAETQSPEVAPALAEGPSAGASVLTSARAAATAQQEDGWDPMEAAWARYVRTRLEAVPARSPDRDTVVVALGSSVMRHALRSTRLTDRKGRQYPIVRITRSGREWDVAAPLEQCVGARPGLLLIELNSLYLHAGVGALLATPWSPRRAGKRTEPEYYRQLVAREDYYTDDQNRSARALEKKRDALAVAPPDERVVTFLDKARETGVAVVLVDLIPRRSDWPLLPPDKLKLIEASLAKLSARTGAKVLRCRFDNDDYTGLSHLTPRGSGKLEACIEEQLANWSAP